MRARPRPLCVLVTVYRSCSSQFFDSLSREPCRVIRSKMEGRVSVRTTTRRSALLPGVLSVLFVVCLLDHFVASAQETKKDQECYNYAGGHVYPGEASRVPVSDHSLHLSKAKSRLGLFYISLFSDYRTLLSRL